MESVCKYGAERILFELLEHYALLEACVGEIRKAYGLLIESFCDGGKLLVCGNGGSAADSEHIVGELMKSFRFKRAINKDFAVAYHQANGCEVPSWLEGALPAISLSSHTALSTAFCNDETAVGVYAQQVYGYGVAGDVFLGISTSGTSDNVVEAAKVARAKDMKVVALTGAKDTWFSRMADAAICVPESETFKVQEYHLPVYHCLCAMVEAEIFGSFK